MSSFRVSACPQAQLGTLAPQLSALSALLRSAALPALDPGVAAHVRGAATDVAAQVAAAADALCELAALAPSRGILHERPPPLLGARGRGGSRRGRGKPGGIGGGATPSPPAGAGSGAGEAGGAGERGGGDASTSGEGGGAGGARAEADAEADDGLALAVSAAAAALPPFTKGREAEGKRVRTPFWLIDCVLLDCRAAAV